MKVIVCEPNKIARVEEIEQTLEAMQEIVGGYIEAVNSLPDSACIVCNEEGRLNEMPLNRGVYRFGDMVGAIYGTFFICGCSDEDFCSLTDEQAEHYLEEFKYPEKFYRICGAVGSYKYEPETGKVVK